jgi:hypothetical protein
MDNDAVDALERSIVRGQDLGSSSSSVRGRYEKRIDDLIGFDVPEGIRFSEIERFVRARQPGIYEIHTVSGVKLKVGVAGDLLARLKDHRASRDSGLKLVAGGDRSKPSDVESKKSILAKHLFYDEAIAPAYDLKSEMGRRRFLEECCLVFFEPTQSRQDAKRLEEPREGSGEFRYVGEVRVRRAE